MNDDTKVLARLAVIDEKIATGFDAVKNRLDISNGRLAKSEIAINELQKADIKLADKVHYHEERSASFELEKRVKRLEIVFYAGVGILSFIEFYTRVIKDII